MNMKLWFAPLLPIMLAGLIFGNSDVRENMSIDPRGAPPAQSEQASPVRSRLELATAIVVLLTALASGIFGLASQRAKSEAQDQAAASSQKVENSTSQIEELERKLTAAQKQIADLQARGSDSAETSGGIDSSGAEIFRSGNLNLANGYHADLDAPTSDPQWGIGHYGFDLGDISWGVIGDSLTANSSLLLDGSATYEKCRTTTGYSSQDISLKYLTSGRQICIQTDQGRYSIITIRKTPTGVSTLQLKVVTYMS